MSENGTMPTPEAADAEKRDENVSLLKHEITAILVGAVDHGRIERGDMLVVLGNLAGAMIGTLAERGDRQRARGVFNGIVSDTIQGVVQNRDAARKAANDAEEGNQP